MESSEMRASRRAAAYRTHEVSPLGFASLRGNCFKVGVAGCGAALDARRSGE
jgi:hypothetical protein